jgi:hypothetical protein
MECVVSEIMHVQYTFRINIIKCSPAKLTKPPLVSFTDSNLIEIMKGAFEQHNICVCVCVCINKSKRDDILTEVLIGMGKYNYRK